jgi:acetamidase/formamidase
VQRIRRDRLAVVFDHRLLSVATVRPGETFVVETEDARGGQNRSPVTTTPEHLRRWDAKGGTAIP